MRIEIVGDDSIGHQARIYAEYRLFAALSQAGDARHVRAATLALGRTKSQRHSGDGVACTVTVEMHHGEIERFTGMGAHPYAAINAVVDRIRLKRGDVRRRQVNATGARYEIRLPRAPAHAR